jgi:hypothetical protein
MAHQSRSGVIVHELTIAATIPHVLAYNEQLLKVISFFVVFIDSCKYEHVKKWLMFFNAFFETLQKWFSTFLCHSSGFACSAIDLYRSPLGLKNWNGICLFTSIRIDKEYSQLLNNICRVVQTKGIIL